MNSEKFNEILDYAIEREQEAHDFYMGLADKFDRPGMKDAFEGFAAEELGHKKKLVSIKGGKFDFPVKKEIKDLKISDYTVDMEVGEIMDYSQALILAMKREKAAFRMYTSLANSSENDELKNVFLSLAQEEAKHKLRFEIEYDEEVLREN